MSRLIPEAPAPPLWSAARPTPPQHLGGAAASPPITDGLLVESRRAVWSHLAKRFLQDLPGADGDAELLLLELVEALSDPAIADRVCYIGGAAAVDVQVLAMRDAVGVEGAGGAGGAT